MRNKILFKATVLLLLFAVLQSCTNENFKPIDMSELNPDIAKKNTPLDQWLKKNFLDPYNSEVIYRNHLYYHEADRNVSPPDVDAVKPMMTTVLEGFVQPYNDVAGIDFMKKNMPRQWVLYGSTSYDGSGVGYAGTASGGVRINLFGLNHFSLTPAFVKGRLGVIHHEFTHILNQRFIMPADFQEITKSRYNGNWTDVATEDAHNWGYVSAYASQNPTEDFAETTKALLVSGQSWFDAWVLTSGSDEGQQALRAKEQSVVGYFNASLNIDFRKLQKEVQTYIKNVLKDPSVTFPYWINEGLYKTITVNPEEQIYATYGLSSDFKEAYDGISDVVAATGRTLNYMQLRFNTPEDLTVRLNYTSSGTEYNADFNFDASINSVTGLTTFVKADQGSGGTYGNAERFEAGFDTTMQKYLTSGDFIADWIPVNTPADMYTTTGGFTKSGESTNYFYGVLGENL